MRNGLKKEIKKLAVASAEEYAAIREPQEQARYAERKINEVATIPEDLLYGEYVQMVWLFRWTANYINTDKL